MVITVSAPFFRCLPFTSFWSKDVAAQFALTKFWSKNMVEITRYEWMHAGTRQRLSMSQSSANLGAHNQCCCPTNGGTFLGFS